MNGGRADAKPSEAWDRFGLALAGAERSAVTVGRGCRASIGSCWQRAWRQAVLVADDTVDRLHGDALGRSLERLAERVVRCTFPAGEASKSRESKARLEDELLAAGVGRDCCLVALGGGVTLDLAGFVAASYLRGIDTLYLPTTLLAQVDAAVGGKTGVNTPAGKNLVGAFHHPSVILVDPDYLTTLPSTEWSHGLAEIVKVGVVADAALFGWVEQRAAALRRGPPIEPHPIARCLQIKARVVEADERERAERRVLNFGHTVGHAIEAASGWRWGHGHAVAVGMAVEACLAVRLVGLAGVDALRLRELLGALGLPVRTEQLSFDDLLPYLLRDKKRAARVRVAVPERIGQAARADGAWVVDTTLEELRDAWQATMAEATP